MAARQKFQKALIFLDRGQLERGEQLLYEVINEAEPENDQIALIQGLVCLGDLLCEIGRIDEAKPLLQRAVSLKREDDVLAVEFDRAKKLLAAHS